MVSAASQLEYRHDAWDGTGRGAADAPGPLGAHVVKSAGERSVSDGGGRRRGALVELGDEEEAVVDGEALHEVQRAGEPDGEGGEDERDLEQHDVGRVVEVAQVGPAVVEVDVADGDEARDRAAGEGARGGGVDGLWRLVGAHGGRAKPMGGQWVYRGRRHFREDKDMYMYRFPGGADPP